MIQSAAWRNQARHLLLVCRDRLAVKALDKLGKRA
jgi:hypothetical protein